MRIAFFGTPDFATESLKKLIEHHYNVVAVITAPDKPAGRGMQLSMSDVKKYALSQNLNILQPEKLKSPEFIAQYQALKIDLAIVVAFRMLPEVIWSHPPMGTFNLHGSLLPNYRGAAPIHWAVINGEKESGVTTFFLKHEIDTGDIIYQEKTDIGPDETTGELYNRLKVIGADLVLKTVQSIENQTITSYPQPYTDKDKHAPKLSKELSLLDDFGSAQAVYNKIRGLNPFPGCFFIHNSKKYSIKKASLQMEIPQTSDRIETDGKTYIYLCCQDGKIKIEELQAEGKKSLKVKDFFNGNSL
jgi:methionyl-tRNA formyltransferase